MPKTRVSAGVMVAALAMALAAGCARTGVPSEDHLRESLERRHDEFFAALAAGEAQGVAALFHDSALVHVAGMPPIEGRAAIREFYDDMLPFLSGSTPTPGMIHVSGSGDLAYGTGRVSNEFRGPEGPVSYAGKYVLVWRRSARDWLIVLYGVSGDQPADSR